MSPPPSAAPLDLLIRAGRVFCPETGTDGPGAVGIRGGRIVSLPVDAEVAARRVLDFPLGLLLPGLVDLHAHPARGQSKFGVDPDAHLLPRGTTTVLSQGDAGAHNWRDYRDRVVSRSRTRVRLALNLAASGEARPGGSLEDLAEADIAACLQAVREIRAEGGDFLWGISVNTSPATCGASDPREAFHRALRVAEESGLPLLVGTRRHPDWPLEEQLPLLRPGDVVTYCFHPLAEGIVEAGRVRECVWRARERGVLFDLGHGWGSFSFAVAEAAVGEGFYPDTVSTDFYARHVGHHPIHDLPRTVSKLVAAGMPESEAFRRATLTPARVLGLEEEVGTLQPGRCADLVVLRWNSSAPPLRDVLGQEKAGGCWEPLLTIREGEEVKGHEAT